MLKIILISCGVAGVGYLVGLFGGIPSTAPWILRQSIDDYVESFHGRASFSRERMIPTDASAFDQAVHTLVSSHAKQVELPIVASVVWGKGASSVDRNG